MKTDSRNVAHLWAHAMSFDAHNSGKTLFIDGTIIYSYGRHFPVAQRMVNDVFLLTKRTHSTTTAKHICYVHRALPPGKRILYVDDVTKDINLSTYKELHEDMLVTFQKAQRASSGKYRLLQETRQLYENLRWLKENCKDIKATPQLPAMFEFEQNKVEKYEEQRQKRLEERQKILLLVNKEKIEKWFSGATNNLPHLQQSFLRIEPANPNRVQTSKGVTVLKFDALITLQAFFAGTLQPGDMVQGFKVESVGVDNLEIGCHIFDRSELERFYNLIK